MEGSEHLADEGDRRLRILLAEDVEDNRLLIRFYVKGENVDLTIAENGQDAVRAFREDGIFDLVLMDIQMPVMDGYEATRRIRSIEAAEGRRPVPVLALTAHASAETKARSLAAGCDKQIMKPIRKKEFLSVIHHFRRGLDGD